MAAVSGITFLFIPNTGTDAVPIYTTAMAGGRSATLTMEMGQIDITTKDSAGWSESLPSTKSWSMDFDNLLTESDAAFTKLKTAITTAITWKFQIKTPAASTYTGTGILTSMKLEGGYEDALKISGTVKGTGILTIV